MKASERIIGMIGEAVLTDNIDKSNNLFLQAIASTLVYIHKKELDDIELKLE